MPSSYTLCHCYSKWEGLDVGCAHFLILASLTFLIGLALKENRKDILSKVYLATPEQAWQIVQGVLSEKSLPFEPTIKHKLYIQTGGINISIEVKKSKLGALVTISPTTPENMPLIESLCAKLDEAFTPRGLK